MGLRCQSSLNTTDPNTLSAGRHSVTWVQSCFWRWDATSFAEKRWSILTEKFADIGKQMKAMFIHLRSGK